MSTTRVIAEAVYSIAESDDEWGKLIVEDEGYSFHIYYDAAFRKVEIEQVTYEYANGTELVLDGLPRWFKGDLFNSVLIPVIEERYEEIKAERALEEAGRIEARMRSEHENKLRKCGDTTSKYL